MFRGFLFSGFLVHMYVNVSVGDCVLGLFSFPHSFPDFPNLALDFPQTTSCIHSIRYGTAFVVTGLTVPLSSSGWISKHLREG